MLLLLRRLKAFLGLMRRKPHSSSISHSFQTQLAAWIPPSIPDFSPAQSCITPHALVASSPQHFSNTFAKRQHQVSPMPIGRTPGDLSRAISLPIIKARCAAQGTRELESQDTNFATEFRKSVLALPKPSSHLLSARECTPPKSGAPESRLATSATDSSETSRLRKSGSPRNLSGRLWWVVEWGGVFP